MSTDTDTIALEIDLLFPSDWISVEPPLGIAAIAVAPQSTNGVYTNIVMHCVALPTNVNAVPSVDRYLVEATAELFCALTNPSINAVWVSVHESQPTHALPLQQRLIVSHEVDGLAVEMIQHHTWLDDYIVVITATIAANPDPDTIELLDRCLLSASSFDGTAATLAQFDDWEPATQQPWAPSPGAVHIPHL